MRKSVQWGLDNTIQDWAFIDFYHKIKLLKQPIGLLSFVATMLTNIKVWFKAEHMLDGSV